MLRIGEFSKLSQVSIKTLRFYDEIGLLKPTLVDATTGYRYYAANLISRLNRILIFKDLGFALEEIALLLQEDLAPDEVRQALQSKRRELSHKIAREQARMAQIESWLTQIERHGRVPDYEIKLKQMPLQLVASVRDHLDEYEQADELFAEVTRHVKRHNASGQRGAIWHACASQKQRIDCEAVVFLNHPVPETRRVRVYELPASTAACALHQGSDETMPQTYINLRLWMKTRGYKIAGPNRELYYQGDLAQGNDSGVTEIQYPILPAQPIMANRP
jgi:DNA-binding transcriptional MerR regulator